MTKKERMYPERKGNINGLIGCGFKCIYCAFAPLQARFGKCEKCKTFTPHEHWEVFDTVPPKTKGNEFITIGLNGDLSFASEELMRKIAEYCSTYSDRTFLLQSKNPAFFIDREFTDNVIIGTTIETNRFTFPPLVASPERREILPPNFSKFGSYAQISMAPAPDERYMAMKKINGRKFVTIEPVMDFDAETLRGWIKEIKPECVYLGYNSRPDLHKLPEPSLEYVTAFIESLNSITEVRPKLLRPAWHETQNCTLCSAGEGCNGKCNR